MRKKLLRVGDVKQRVLNLEGSVVNRSASGNSLTLYRCVKCGVATDWEEELGSKPFCSECWDAEADIESEVLYQKLVKRREYYEAHIGANRAGCRLYRSRHRKELADYHRRYCQARRELIAERQREFYRVHREAELARARRYREANKEVITIN